jgi:outer membrane protein OmpA-like peptidoglycan-associated protein
VTTTRFALVLAVGLGACASSRVSPMLAEAREAYEEARTGPANKYAPDLVYEARTSLEEAERAHMREPGSAVEEHLAYLAHRRSLMAMASADERVAYEEAASARQRFDTELVAQRDEANASSSRFQADFERERALRQRAEDDARAARAALAEIATVEATERSFVITLPGDALFAKGDARLRAQAGTRLDRVAETLRAQDDGGSIAIAGFADSRTDDDAGRRLAQRRATAVRDALVARGLSATRVHAVAAVDPPAGRAPARNVAIVVEPPPPR